MIEINLYKDGAYIVGHDILENCRFVSYAIKSCIDNCLKESNDIEHYQSGLDKDWYTLGFTYIRLTENNDNIECKKILERFKNSLINYIKLEELRIPIHMYDDYID